MTSAAYGNSNNSSARTSCNGGGAISGKAMLITTLNGVMISFIFGFFSIASSIRQTTSLHRQHRRRGAVGPDR